MKNLKGIYWATFFLFLAATANAQSFDSTSIYPVPVGNNWGYIDCKGKIVLEPLYDYAKDFYNNKAAVVRKGRFYGIINLKGELLVPYAYQSLKLCWKMRATQGYLYIAYNGAKYGVVNLKNEIIIPFVYKKIEAINKHLFKVKTNHLWGAINTKKEMVIPLNYKMLESKRSMKNFLMAKDTSKKWAVFSPKGKQICPHIFDHPNVNVSSYYINGLTDASPLTINHQGLVQTDLKMKVSRFYNNSNAIARGENKLYGIVDQELNWILQPKYKALSYEIFHQNSQVVLFLQGERWGLMNLKGELLIEAKYEMIDYVSESIVALSKDGEYYQLFDWKSQKFLNENQYSHCVGNKEAQMIEVNLGKPRSGQNQWTVLNTKGELILSSQYSWVSIWDSVIGLTQYADKYSEGIFSIAEGRFVVPPIFSQVDYNSNRLTKVVYQETYRNKIAYLHPNGAVVWSAHGFDVQLLIDNYFEANPSADP